MSTIRVIVGLGTSAVTTGLGKLRGQFREFRNDVNSEFGLGQFLAVGAVLAGLDAVLDKAGQLADLSARFGVGVEGLQQIGNAAAQDGVEMEGVAAALNKAVVAQAKARAGDEEMTKALDDLGIKAADFINLSPDEAFYAIADGVANSDDQTKAYAATLQLLGRGAGALIPTLQRGSEEIREIGNAAGVMSEDTVAILDDAGDKITALVNQLKVWGASALSWLYKGVQTFGASLAAVVAKAQYLFGAIDKAERDATVQAAKDIVDEIWAEKKPDEEKKKRKTFDVEESEKKIEGAKELQRLYDQIDEQKRKAALEAMDSESKINELIKQRNQLYEDAAGQSDAKKQAEMWLKAGELEKDILAERERVAKEQERLEAERKKAEEDAAEKKRKEEEAAAAKKPEEEVVASSLAKIGGGGFAVLSRKDPDVARTAKATEKAAQETAKAVQKLEQIRQKIGEQRWNP